MLQGSLCFRCGEPSEVQPKEGKLVVYSADIRNEHCVQPVVSGNRFTFTLWLTREQTAAEEEGRLLEQLRLRVRRLDVILYVESGLQGHI